MKLLTSGARAFVALCLAFLICGPATAQPDPKLIFFGDSLSDAGNYFIEFGEVSRAPFEPVPSAPYAIGGHHFSNGATWTEDITEILHVPPNGKPALRVPGLFTNYAVGRSRARSNAPVFSASNLSIQVGIFLEDFGSHAPSDATYVIWFGADDLQDALNALATDPGGGTSAAILQQAIKAIADNIQALWGAGARSFLILNVPDLALTPFVRSLGPGAQQAATLLTTLFNGALAQTVAGLQVLPQTVLMQFDANALFHEVLIAPEDFGLTDVEDACLSFGVKAQFMCAQPGRYLFWDGIHPTRVAHAILAEAVARDIFDVEPKQTGLVR